MSEQANKTNDNFLEDVSLERLPKGVVTMLLTGYTKALEDAQKSNRELSANFTKAVKAMAISMVIIVTVCVGGFLWYLSTYECTVTSYGTVENSHVNASSGTHSDTNNYYGEGAINADKH